MALRLRVVGDQAARLGELSRFTFGVNGGRIGRALDNDWVLPDVERYVSARHAEIQYRSGQWILRDVSSNGTYVNGRPDPLGPGFPYALRNGDRLRIGEFRMVVEISGGNDFPPDEGEIDHGDTLGVPLDDVLPGSASDAPAAGRPMAAAGAQGAPAAPAPAGAPRPAAMARAPSGAPDATRARPEAAPPPRAGGRDDRDLLPGLAALCRGAGIDPAALPPGTRSMVLHQAGQVLRELLLGLLEMRRSRAEFTREFGISAPARLSSGTSPLMRLSGVEDLLLRWLAQDSANSRPIDEVRGMFAEARTHEHAVSLAVRAGLEGLVGRLDPDKFDRANVHTAFDSPQARERLWLRYRDSFRAGTLPEETGVPEAFANEFARTYRTLVHEDDDRSSDESLIRLE